MFADKIAAVRQSLEMKSSVGAKNVAVRDSTKIDTAQYSIDAQISQNNKKILQAFKQNSGYYHVSPKKQKSSSPEKQPVVAIPQQKASEQCPRIYLFGKNGDYFSKPSEQAEQKTLTNTVLKETGKSSYNSTFQNSLCCRSIGTSISSNKNEQFLREVLQTLGIINSNDVKLQFNDLLNTAYARFVDMKSNGRWQLIQKYFKGADDQDLSYSCATNNRSIIKKKSLVQTQAGQAPTQTQQKKKVKVIQPQTASQLTRTKQKLSEQLQINIKKLTKGYKFSKYCYNIQRVQQIIIYLSYDMKCLAWQVHDKNSNSSKQPVVESMLNYNGITQGSRSKNYQKYVNKRYKIDQQLAFSIMLKNRTLDLMAANHEEKVEFIQAVKFVRTFI